MVIYVLRWINESNMSLKWSLLWKINLFWNIDGSACVIYMNIDRLKGGSIFDRIKCAFYGNKHVMIIRFYKWIINQTNGRFIVSHVHIISILLLYQDIITN